MRDHECTNCDFCKVKRCCCGCNLKCSVVLIGIVNTLWLIIELMTLVYYWHFLHDWVINVTEERNTSLFAGVILCAVPRVVMVWVTLAS